MPYKNVLITEDNAPQACGICCSSLIAVFMLSPYVAASLDVPNSTVLILTFGVLIVIAMAYLSYVRPRVVDM